MENHSEDNYDITYKKMLSLYDMLIKGVHTRPALSYFDEIVDLYNEGDRITKIRAIEIILRILQGKIVKNSPQEETEDIPSGIGIVQYRLQQIKNRMFGSSIGQNQSHQSYHLAKDGDLLQWLEETLVTEEDEKILTTFFIFVKPNWDRFTNSGISTHDRLINLHHMFIRMNKAYRKLASFDRLYFS